MAVSGTNGSIKQLLAATACLVALGASTRALGIDTEHYEERLDPVAASEVIYEAGCD